MRMMLKRTNPPTKLRTHRAREERGRMNKPSVEMLGLMETRCLPRLLDDLTPAPEESMLRC